MSTDWKLIGKLKASSHRMRIMECLLDEVKQPGDLMNKEKIKQEKLTPEKMRKKLNAKFSHVSRTLKELMDVGLVKCLNPEARVGRLYDLTPKGREVMAALKRKKKK